MSVVITRLWTERNRIVYLLTTGGSPLGGTSSIPATGGVTPDLVTDGAINTDGGAVAAALRRVVRAGLDGLGVVAAAGFTQAISRLLFLSGGGATLGNGFTTPTAQLRLVPSTGTVADWKLDANVTAGVPQIDITAAAVAATAYLYVELDHSLAK